MLNKKSVDDINVKGKRVLVRCDFNVPLDGDKITDETRLVAALPTIKKLVADGGKVILCSHLGKPKGPDAAFSLAPVAKRLTELLGKEVKFAADDTVVGDNAKAAVEAMNDGDIILLENTRFRAEETKNGEAFSKDLASIADVFVNDAFGTAHRAHCSNVGVTQFVDTAVVGYLMQKEIDFLGNAVNNPVRPFVAILGGSKVSSKIPVINNLLDKVDTLIIGGGMSYTFQKAKGGSVGKSLVEDDYLDYAKEMMAKAEAKGVKLLIPIDTVTTKEFANDTPSKIVEAGNQEADDMGMDIGPKTCELYKEALKDAKTVVWNGPMGVFEFDNFAKGTVAVAEALANLKDATTIIGGGDSAAAVNNLGFGDKMTHISTGGGASLEFLEGKELPGVVAANDK
ncbi:MAG: phosphoglycerate kinase [Lachnospira sp.]|uniref:Phosphoglycerate kinase n=1 Tax=Lachnospira pectinoschiza TaxID=28052 RepID=A0A1G9VY54_9FIRM|nr:phosphoglycerate kinase [Lachnospira pectinoschiza]MCR5516692.1 phosphoglycerate kinase [Lachnospira sp.]SDM77229.1 phosphoglycerate kinase [Lachnospira pectinoschiza]